MLRTLIRTGVLLLLLGCGSSRVSNSNAFKPPVEIPFEIFNNFIVINFKVNGLSDCRFIFDTGSDNSLFFEHSIAQLLRFNMVRKMKIYGSDLSQQLTADIALGVNFTTGSNNFTADILVLEENIFELDEYFGFPVYGIIGNSMFKNKQVEINYSRQRIYVYDHKPAAPTGYQEMEVRWEYGKPYVFPLVQTQSGSTPVRLKLLFDTGATLGLLIYDPEEAGLGYPEKMIPGNLGMGIGGPIKGFIGRFNKLELGNYRIPEVITHFHAIDTSYIRNDRSNKMGIIGNGLLSHFNVYLDYANEKLYLKPHRSLDEPIQTDRSGMLIVATGPNFSKLMVKEVMEGSPAAAAGVLPGDILQRINGRSTFFLSLSRVNKLLSSRKHKSLEFTLLRDGKKLKKKIILQDLI